jgi:hypothetical protein
VALLVAGGLVMAGRLTIDPGSGPADAYRVGHSDGFHTGYVAGVQDGVVQGRQEGRVLQEVGSVPAASRQPVRAAYNDGYVAGANDVFAGYDGGWVLSAPYVVTLERARTPVVYRIGSRSQMQPGVDYFLCPDGRALCQEARR